MSGPEVRARTVDARLEVIVIPVSDVERSKAFYGTLGWRQDAEFIGRDGFHILQFTPPGSPCSVIFGAGVTSAAPGSAKGLHLVVSDIEAARADLAARGVAVSEPFHDAGGVFHHAGDIGRVGGPDPERRSYSSFASFLDPDGNEWIFQEVTARLPGRIDTDVTAFTSERELEAALRRAAAAHGEHEKRTGQHDADWPVWYAQYIAREQAGRDLPT